MASCESQRAERMSSSSAADQLVLEVATKGWRLAYPPRTGRHYRGYKTPRIPCWRRRARCIVPGAACVGRAEGLRAGAVAFCNLPGPGSPHARSPGDLIVGNHIRRMLHKQRLPSSRAMELQCQPHRTLFHLLQNNVVIGHHIRIGLLSRTVWSLTIKHDPGTPAPKYPNQHPAWLGHCATPRFCCCFFNPIFPLRHRNSAIQTKRLHPMTLRMFLKLEPSWELEAAPSAESASTSLELEGTTRPTLPHEELLPSRTTER